MRYHCDKCEYAATTASLLKIHIKIKHGGLKCPCDKYEYAATSKRNLKNHIENKHE